ncbi:MAG: hypothetical protein PHN88_11715 [Ignavibacteria bacterium]|nr:hypothetical protein [Ignavibacteria bacterium]
MKIRILALMLLIGFFAVLTFNDASAQSTPTVKVSVSKKSVKPGETAYLVIKFKHGTQVKIPKEPPIEVSISGDGVSGISVQDYSGGEGDYINNSQIKYKFKVNSDATSGSSITVSGTVKFGYCSTETGTCKMATKNFTVKVKVK